MKKRQEISVQTIINADAAKVWEYYTDPGHITRWNFASDDWYCPRAVNDLKAGGKYTARMEAKDGSAGFDFEAVYDEIIDGKKIVYTIADGRKVTITFEEAGDKTKTTTLFEAENENPVAMQQQGWQAILDNFKTYTETH
ncbi:activator of HSP90 ATPase [Niabella ginsenosidivorans]|uniref:Activator of HSP90 ATPase n=1 Tax=Niabella ginsenosidivorans TaxID=1176587 RepID=A0A1A9I7Q9_9BACT|nr:SRPBCC family protein [Niabella ginsenosidivorans]ANH83718.1 activator of HSP90 ATPase [Niabella ginsenosidivorans]